MVNNSYRFPTIIATQAKKYKDKPALFDRYDANQPWVACSWNEMNVKVNQIANAFIELGLKKKEMVAQFSQNKSENLIVDFALYSVGAIMVPIYSTSTFEQVDFIIENSESKILFVGNKSQYEIALKVKAKSNNLEQIIVFEKGVELVEGTNSIYFDDLIDLGRKSNHTDLVEKRREQIEEKDIMCLLYTSGTSGTPKGVIMTYEMYHESIRIHKIRLAQITDKDTSIAFLPLTHVFERSWSYILMFIGATIYINHFPLSIQKTIRDVQPTLMCAVPRFWEKVYSGVQDVLKNYSPIMLTVVNWALAVGKKYNIDYLRVGKKPSFWLTKKYKLADKLVFSKLKDALGLGNSKILPVGGAKLSDEINTFFLGIGVPLLNGYGLTETTASVSTFTEHYEIGTVGHIMPDIQVKIGKDNEILLKGKTVTPGYYKNHEANKEAFTEDGWFRTGDAGILKDGQIALTERLKDLFKTSNGKYIAPQKIETLLGSDNYIDYVTVVADERNFVTAIIVPAFAKLKKYASSNNISYQNMSELVNNKSITNLMKSRIDDKQKELADYEQIKKFKLIEFPFSIETGELTNTLKIRRAVIMQKYKSKIDEMYRSITKRKTK